MEGAWCRVKEAHIANLSRGRFDCNWSFMGGLNATETPAFLTDLLNATHDARQEFSSGHMDIRDLVIPELKAAGTTRYSQIPVADDLIRDNLVDLDAMASPRAVTTTFTRLSSIPFIGIIFQSATPQVLFLEGLAERLARRMNSCEHGTALSLNP